MSSGVLTRGPVGPPRASRAASAPAIDPRLAARRSAVAQARVSRRRRRVLVAVVLVAVVAGVWALTRSAALDVDRVAVTGASVPARAEVVEAAGVGIGSPLLDLDTEAVASRVEALPWVKDARVQRRWPGTVSVQVVSRVPVAVDPNGQAVDAGGRVIGTVVGGTVVGGDDGGADGPIDGGAVASLPRIDVAFGRPGTVVDSRHRNLVTVVADLPAALRTEVASARVVGPDAVLTLVDGISVRVGDASRLTAKYVALEALLDQADRQQIEAIDLRVPSSPSVTPRDADQVSGSQVSGAHGSATPGTGNGA